MCRWSKLRTKIKGIEREKIPRVRVRIALRCPGLGNGYKAFRISEQPKLGFAMGSLLANRNSSTTQPVYFIHGRSAT
jgi:hypothetical protein